MTPNHIVTFFSSCLFQGRPVTLRFAATVMWKMYFDESTFYPEKTIKAVTRRLYNVANVLLGCDALRQMVKKVKVNRGSGGGANNAYVYVGPGLVELTPELVADLPDCGVEVIQPIVTFHKNAKKEKEGGPEVTEVRVKVDGDRRLYDLTHFQH